MNLTLKTTKQTVYNNLKTKQTNRLWHHNMLLWERSICYKILEQPQLLFY